MLLPVLQTTSTATDDSNLDALTLVLVAIFVVSMVALTVLGARRPGSSETERDSAPLSKPEQAELPETRPPREHAPVRPAERTPVWLQGVAFPTGAASLAEASRVIEELLAARRERDLERGSALLSPRHIAELRQKLGVDAAGLHEALREASFEGDPPELRSVEIISASTGRMTVRAGYGNRSSETYALVRNGECWLIDSIDPR